MISLTRCDMARGRITLFEVFSNWRYPSLTRKPSRAESLVSPITPFLPFYSSSPLGPAMLRSCPVAVPWVVSRSTFRCLFPQRWGAPRGRAPGRSSCCHAGLYGPCARSLVFLLPFGVFWLVMRCRGAAYGVCFSLAIVTWPVPGVLRFSFGVASFFVRRGGLASPGCLAAWRRRPPVVAGPLRCVSVLGLSRSYLSVGGPLSLNFPRGRAVKSRPLVRDGPWF